MDSRDQTHQMLYTSLDVIEIGKLLQRSTLIKKIKIKLTSHKTNLKIINLIYTQNLQKNDGNSMSTFPHLTTKILFLIFCQGRRFLRGILKYVLMSFKVNFVFL